MAHDPKAREAFVLMIKSENNDGERWSAWSLKQHWAGKERGFADDQLQRRWHDFEAGWKAAKGTGNGPTFSL